MKRFWSLEWETLNTHILQKQTNSKHNPHPWLESVLTLLGSNFFKLWKIKNKHNHGCDSVKKNYLLRERTISKLIYIYSLRSQICSTDHNIFSQDLATLSDKSTAVIEVWIRMFGPIIKHSQKKLKQKIKTRDIHKYFTWYRK